MKKVAPKKVTIDDLALIMTKGFKDVNAKVDEEINSLATMVAKGFDGVNKEIGEVKDRLGNVESRLGNVEDRLGGVEKEVAEVKENLSATRRDVLETGDRFVPRYEFHDLLVRFDKLEQRVKAKK